MTQKSRLRHIVGCIIVALFCYTVWNVFGLSMDQLTWFLVAPAEETIITWMDKKRVVDEAHSKVKMYIVEGYIPSGDDLLTATMTVEEAKLKCEHLPRCEGFSYIGPPTSNAMVMNFKNKSNVYGKGWTSVLRPQASMSLDIALKAVETLERMGRQISIQDLRSVDTTKAEAIRVNMFEALVAKQSKSKLIYDQVRRRVDEALTLLQPGRAWFDAQEMWGESQTPLVSRGLHWISGRDKVNCAVACKERNLHCAAEALYVQTAEELKKAAEAAGFTCDKIHHQRLWGEPWDGPWVLNSECAFVPHGYWQSDCNKHCAFDRICPCSEEPGPNRMPLPFYNPGGSALIFNFVSPKGRGLSPFASIDVTLPLDSSLIDRGAGQGGQERATVGHESLSLLNRSCVVYSFGAGYETNYEKRMASFGCRVHVFDCTMTSNPAKFLDYIAELVPFENVIFHAWCVGEKPQAKYESAYGVALDQFFTFDQVMARLGHRHVDVVKFDIEGFEWQLLDSLLSSIALPDQIAFELHTAGAKEGAVPPALVHHKGQYEVDALFQRLFSLGYHVANKEVNVFDSFCCEFVVVRLCGGPFTQACRTL